MEHSATSGLRARLDYINLYQCDSGFATGERVFDFPYLLYVHKGLGTFRIGQAAHTGRMGDLFFCPAGVGNTIAADGEDPFLLTGIDFRADGAGDSLSSLLGRVSLLPHPFLISLVNQMVSEHAVGKIRSGEICDALLTALLHELIRFARIGPPGEESVRQQVLGYLRDNGGRTVCSSELSNVFSYHRSSVNRIVRSATGLSPRAYQIAARIRMAEELLAYSNRPLGEIAALCGYASPVFFSRQFREKTGRTPGAYRRARQKSD